MTTIEFWVLFAYLMKKCRDLKDKYIEEKLEIDYVCIFAQSREEYEGLIEVAKKLGSQMEETDTGPVFKFHKPPKTFIGSPKVLKIRIPDEARSQRGDVDFVTDYANFKNKYFDNDKFKLIKRDKFEMIELRDDKFDVLVYFSSIPPSKLLEIK